MPAAVRQHQARIQGKISRKVNPFWTQLPTVINLKTVEDMPGGYVANVEKTFSVSQGLAEKYTTIVMLGSFRFGES